ncbi:MAG: (2Fe-2S)-binding protein [Sulfurimonas sp.]|nr:(2Fe-2S)-binding protein [Sulfurimonas sp.]
MIDKNTEVCVCNHLSAGDIAACIKENSLFDLESLLANDQCPIGNKCKSCRDEGYNNDGINIPLVLSMVKKGLL